tara:strand:+ start:5085 stop:5291 length:207 start_codon:yes stop_codon:yes gene_type:complete
MINRDDIEAFADMSTAELINQISVLTGEIEYAKSQLQPHDTGHIHTAIYWMEQRIFELEEQVRTLEAL